MSHSIPSETNGIPNDEASDASYITGDDNDELSEDSDDSTVDSNNNPDEDSGNNVADNSTESSGDDAGPEPSLEDTKSCAEDSEFAMDNSDDVSAECSAMTTTVVPAMQDPTPPPALRKRNFLRSIPIAE